ncbi:MAG TPA: LuxR C-terminal-related transcriptional regulator [Chloroflexota bacterium]|nr:LuxR C-terminal-related transcriptional regulator [Chloroflexota bacterium]HUM69023.1 LuxR C-terminal-related transcriptional regulator [Chloroflexota bacterium]
MSGELLQTKLYVPRLRPSLIPRPHLIAKLNQGLQQECRLTLISAPAGFGKTTLITEWIANCERPFAWFSLDQRDSDLTRFLQYLIATLQTLYPATGIKTLALLTSAQPPTESILTTLLNEIAAVPQEFALVLDDYHVLDAPPIDEALTFLLEHLPPQMHLVITTREDPLLPLPRLRVRGLLTEVRAADLRFTMEETAVFLQQISGLQLSADEIAALEKRTEGWIAGLQLAALSMQGRADVHGFIKAFAGDDRYVVDYLVDEVLQRQPEPIHRFLLQTSILDRLCGSLCDAVTNGETGSALLATLEQNNLFVIPLDDKRTWYRYHHLFADVLQVHLLKEQPQQIADLHQRASEWYELNDFAADAVHHAFAAGDFARAARIIELAWAEMDRSRQSATWLGWATRLPDAQVRNRPVLCLSFAWALLDAGQLEAAERWLQNAEKCLQNTAVLIVADEVEYQHLPGSIAAARTYLALALGDMPATVNYAQQALDLLPQEEHLRRGTPAALLGLALWSDGKLVEAQHAFAEAMSSYEKAGNILFVITGAYVLADMKRAQGRLHEAAKIYEDALQLAQTHGEIVMRGAADLYTGLSELRLEQNQLAAAQEHLRQSQTLGEEAALPRWHYRWCLAQAKMEEAAGNLEAALNSLDEADNHYVRGPVPDVRSTAAMKARIWLKQGRLAKAHHWANAQGLAVTDDLSYLREFDHITLARLRLAQYRRDGAEKSIADGLILLERLLETAVTGQRMGSLLEILVLQALAFEAKGDTPAALASLARALTLTESEGYVRLFVDEGLPMTALLEKLQADSEQRVYLSQLLAAFDNQNNLHPSSFIPSTDSTALSRSGQAPQPLIEPLSERELEVLQLVAAGLSNREISERLFLALPTVKGHNRNIYSKLNVTRRTEAVARARELGLL